MHHFPNHMKQPIAVMNIIIVKDTILVQKFASWPDNSVISPCKNCPITANKFFKLGIRMYLFGQITKFLVCVTDKSNLQTFTPLMAVQGLTGLARFTMIAKRKRASKLEPNTSGK
jgi:hypothetical protein